jgi:RHS repeat-associated protein
MLFQSEQMQTSLAANANPYLYNGKEIQDMPGKWYDYGKRFYDATVGRWFVVDAMAEKYYEWTGFNYALNNPIVNTDPNGDTVLVFIDNQGAGGQGHMAMAFQNDKGEWFYFSQGATGNPDQSKLLAGSDANGGVDLIPLKVSQQIQDSDAQGKPKYDKDGNPVMKTITRNPTKSEVESIAKSGQLGYQYDDNVTINTSQREDKRISQTAHQLQRDYRSGKEEYNVYFNNCTDAVQTAIQKRTNINLPIDFDPRPNKYFEKLKKNINKINEKKRKQP